MLPNLATDPYAAPERSQARGSAQGGAAGAPARWRVRLLGAVEARGPTGTIARWPSRAVAALLARLALAPERVHPREELVDLLWPGVPLEVGRNRLRQALSALKALLEPPGPYSAPVIAADRQAVRVVPGALECDVRQLVAHALAGKPAAGPGAAIDELMPGYYDEWICEERLRLGALFERAAGSAGQRPDATALPAVPVPVPLPVSAGSTALLPGYLTRPFGLDDSARELRALVREQRLVSVHGPGGSGKTRLAVEAAGSLASGTQTTGGFDAVSFVPLVACESPAEVLQTMADLLGPGGSGEPRARVLAALHGRRVLLVLDNLEQLSREAEREIESLLCALPRLHVLVTSRRALGLDGETVFELDGLAVPDEGAPLDEAAASPAVALFVDRARAVRADFRLCARNVGPVGALVRLLQGMPLAIELAASRVRTLAPYELLQRLRAGSGTPTLDLLVRRHGNSTVQARHASMRHMVQWSWCRLEPAQMALLHAMSVFVAPADEALIAAVVGQTPVRVRVPIDELHDLSLLTATPDGRAGPTYALLQPVREFAAEQAGAEALRAARDRLRRALLERASVSELEALASMADVLPHVQEALVRAPGDGDGRCALELAVALRPLWQWEVLPLPAVRALEQCLDAVGDDAALLADVLDLLATACLVGGESDVALAHIERARSLPLDDGRRGMVIGTWAIARYYAGAPGPELLAAAEQAVALAERSGDVAARAGAYRVLASALCNLRLEYAAAEVLMARAQALHEGLGDHRMALRRLQDRAVMWAWLGRDAEAAGVLLECADAARQHGDWTGAILSLRQLGRVYVRLHRWDDAAVAFTRALSLAWARCHAEEIGVVLLHLPDALVHRPQRIELAVRLQGFAQAHWSRLFGKLNRIEQRELRRTRRLLRLRLGAARAETLRVQGVGWSLPEAVALALACRPAAGRPVADVAEQQLARAAAPRAGGGDADAAIWAT